MSEEEKKLFQTEKKMMEVLNFYELDEILSIIIKI